MPCHRRTQVREVAENSSMQSFLVFDLCCSASDSASSSSFGFFSIESMKYFFHLQIIFIYKKAKMLKIHVYHVYCVEVRFSEFFIINLTMFYSGGCCCWRSSFFYATDSVLFRVFSHILRRMYLSKVNVCESICFWITIFLINNSIKTI